MAFEHVLIGVAVLLLLSIVASKASGRLGVPALLLFLGIGMLAGSERLGGIPFDNYGLAQNVGVVALAFILFAGGLDTDWKSVRGSVRNAVPLATGGVLLTAVIVGWFAHVVAGLPLVHGLLVGSIVSSTDAAAVFAILRSRGVQLRPNLAATLELESGSNDPMAVFLTVSCLQVIMQPQTEALTLVIDFITQMTFGAIAGLMFARAGVWLINHLRLEYDGLYPVLTIAIVLTAYGVTATVGGNGFLAVYLTGIGMSSRSFVQRRALTRFHDGVAWLMQITMFLVLGLLAAPSALLPVAGSGIAIALVQMFLARPAAVFAATIGTNLELRERLLMAWVGLRGAAPIILATFPLLAGIPKAQEIFNIVFFAVLASVLLQGPTIPFVARLLRVDLPESVDRSSLAHLAGQGASSLVTLEIAPDSRAAGRRIVELEWPREAHVLVVYRGDGFLIPNGGTEIRQGDRVVVLTPNTLEGLLRDSVSSAA